MHGAHAAVRAEDGAEEAAAQMQFRRVGLDGKVLRLAGEVAEHHKDWVGWRDVFRFADHDEDVLVVAVDGDGRRADDSGNTAELCSSRLQDPGDCATIE